MRGECVHAWPSCDQNINFSTTQYLIKKYYGVKFVRSFPMEGHFGEDREAEHRIEYPA
jgi:hypothetical protein